MTDTIVLVEDTSKPLFDSERDYMSKTLGEMNRSMVHSDETQHVYGAGESCCDGFCGYCPTCSLELLPSAEELFNT